MNTLRLLRRLDLKVAAALVATMSFASLANAAQSPTFEDFGADFFGRNPCIPKPTALPKYVSFNNGCVEMVRPHFLELAPKLIDHNNTRFRANHLRT